MMSARFDSTTFISPRSLGERIAARAEIWQMRFLDPKGLARFTGERGLFFSDEDIQVLWQLGLLRADFVTSEQELQLVGLVEVGTNDSGQHLYADERRLQHRPEGWASAVAEMYHIPPGASLYFHPFRYYVLFHLDQTLRINVSPMQLLYDAAACAEIIDSIVSDFRHKSGGLEFPQEVERWNNIATLASATEPCTYEELFHTLSPPTLIDLDTLLDWIEQHRVELLESYREASVDGLEVIRRDLCFYAKVLDPNRDVHTLLRLARDIDVCEIRGRLGGTLCLLTMAEMIRRATEMAFGVDLPEEDELSSGRTSSEVKKTLYGSARIRDGARSAAHQFVRRFGLDYGICVRWYVEGATEFGALQAVLGQDTSIELIDLAGEFVQSRRKGLAFRDSLKNDKESETFSFVLLDKDKAENIRVARKAAEDDVFCGRFFVSDPDVEFENFSLSELEDLVWDEAVENGAQPHQRAMLHDSLAGVSSGKALEDAARKALKELNQFRKGETWGRRLGEFAWNNPFRTDETTAKPAIRPIVKAIKLALRAERADYSATCTRLRVDPSTGELVERK